MERKPHSVWCGNNLEAVNPDCYFVDKEGYIYSQAPIFSGNIYVRGYSNLELAIEDASPVDYIGKYFLATDIYSQIFTLINILDQRNIKVNSVWFDGREYNFIIDKGCSY